MPLPAITKSGLLEENYIPDHGGTDQFASFTITGNKDGLNIYGGFQSGDSFGDRNPAIHTVILNGDIEGDGTLNGNSYHVLLFDGGDAIRHSFAANIADIGGAVYNFGDREGISSPVDHQSNTCGQ